MRSATLGLVLACTIAPGCSSADDQPEAGVGDAAIDDPLIELPPPSSTGDSASPGVRLGRWDWGSRCRVGVHEIIGAGDTRVARTFTVDVVASGAGFVVSFDDVSDATAGVPDEVVADTLFRHLAVLPSMRLDADGQFVEFVSLHTALADLARRAGVASADDVALMLARQPVVGRTILDRTTLAWFGFWLEHDTVPVAPERLEGEHSRTGPAGMWRWVTETAASPVTGALEGRGRDDAVRLMHRERAVDAASGSVEAIAIVDPSALRPSSAVLTIDGFASGGRPVFAERDRRVVTFDWGRAAGCV